MDQYKTFIIADNQDITRAGMHGYISCLFPRSTIKDVSCKNELVSAIVDSGKEVVIIIDYTLFDINGADEMLILANRFRQSYCLLFSNGLGDAFIRRLSSEPNVGMLLKECADDEIRSALFSAVAGRHFLCGMIKEQLASLPAQCTGMSSLTATETEILRLIAHGKSVKEIAALRISSVHTIVTHKKNIFRKLEINNVYEATRYALRAGLVEMADYYL